MTRLPFVLAACLIGGLVSGQAVLAEEHGEHGLWQHDHPRGYDWNHWRRGGWINGWHEGRLGWWWVVDGVWFFYHRPVYPVPQPPTVVVTPAPQAPSGYYYYCPNPPGYYPTVPQCQTGWQLLPAAPTTTPAPAAPVTAPPPPPPPPIEPPINR